jgi:Flp pilus assembly protein TadB
MGATAAIAVVGLGSAAIQYQQGEEQRKMNKKQLAMQEQAQDQATAAAKKREEERKKAMRAAGQNMPDTSVFTEAARKRAGKSETLLTGVKGARPGRTGGRRSTGG